MHLPPSCGHPCPRFARRPILGARCAWASHAEDLRCSYADDPYRPCNRRFGRIHRTDLCARGRGLASLARGNCHAAGGRNADRARSGASAGLAGPPDRRTTLPRDRHLHRRFGVGGGARAARRRPADLLRCERRVDHGRAQILGRSGRRAKDRPASGAGARHARGATTLRSAAFRLRLHRRRQGAVARLLRGGARADPARWADRGRQHTLGRRRR